MLTSSDRRCNVGVRGCGLEASSIYSVYLTVYLRYNYEENNLPYKNHASITTFSVSKQALLNRKVQLASKLRVQLPLLPVSVAS